MIAPLIPKTPLLSLQATFLWTDVAQILAG
ncbi:MAG: hypothetical protein QOJ99_1187 [Bryobacterales bacterium]|jgi:hypothetical protein|nr:hypothetical protein [Bryobacterales bacterium]